MKKLLLSLAVVAFLGVLAVPTYANNDDPPKTKAVEKVETDKKSADKKKSEAKKADCEKVSSCDKETKKACCSSSKKKSS